MLGKKISKLKTPKILRTNASFPDICLCQWVLGCKMPRAKSRILLELPKRTNAATPRDESIELCIQRHATEHSFVKKASPYVTKATNLEHGEELHGLLLIQHLNLR